jgi:hypothetical protein
MAGKIRRAGGSKMMRQLLWALGIAFVLLVYSAFRFPSALSDPSGLMGDFLILITYGLVFQLWFSGIETRAPQVIQVGSRTGLVVGVIFVAEMLLEYIVLPSDNSTLGLVEYGSVLAIIFLVSIWITYKTGKFRNGVFTAIVSAMIGSIIWLIAVLAIFYLFYGTQRQIQVFRAEGTYEDFARSGMTNFDAFLMQDFWGAGFFHSILLPVLASILGSIGSLLGVFFVWIYKRYLIKIK